MPHNRSVPGPAGEAAHGAAPLEREAHGQYAAAEEVLKAMLEHERVGLDEGRSYLLGECFVCEAAVVDESTRCGETRRRRMSLSFLFFTPGIRSCDVPGAKHCPAHHSARAGASAEPPLSTRQATSAIARLEKRHIARCKVFYINICKATPVYPAFATPSPQR